MKTSLNWLADYVDLPWSAGELTERLTLAGLEVEGVETIGAIPPGVVVAEILSREAHPNADKLSVCTVDGGQGAPLTVVCGAPNCDVGNKVPLATVGTVLPGAFTIKPAKLRGVTSHGMLCSARELGVGVQADGLLLLAADAPVGQPVGELFAADTVVDWEITPNRPDWASHIGIAREIAAVADCAKGFALPKIELKPVGEGTISDLATVDVRDPDLCPRYTARIVRRVTIGPSPDWLQRRLQAIGLRPINNVVDITNFVMMECGQPLHAFDYDRLAEHTIIVRRAQPGETLTTLDERTCKLAPDHLLIADAAGGVALAGVMGGANSEISETTTTVLLESAAFNASNIRRTARGLGYHTDSSYRFERGVGLEMVDWASRRACALICEIAGGELVDGVLDAYATPYRPHRVSCRVERANRLLGTSLSAPEMTALLVRLGLDIVDQNEQAFTVSVPSYRLDLEREVDLIEEIARLHGLDKLPSVRPLSVVGGPRSADAYYPIQEAREQLLAMGLSEAMNYSLTSIVDATGGTGVGEEDLIGLDNPISVENGFLRPSLLSGLLRNVAHNVAHQVTDVALFEIGRVAVNRPDRPEERTQVGVALTGRRHPERYGPEREEICDFYDLKGLLESWFAARRTPCRTVAAEHAGFRDGACAAIEADGRTLAVFGEIDAKLLKGMRLTTPLYVALVEFERLRERETPKTTFAPLPHFPGTQRDISLVAPGDLANAEIVDAILSFDTPALQRVELFDVYEDEAVLGKGKRSLAYSLTYRDANRTLTDEEANAMHDRVKAKLAKKLPVEYR